MEDSGDSSGFRSGMPSFHLVLTHIAPMNFGMEIARMKKSFNESARPGISMDVKNSEGIGSSYHGAVGDSVALSPKHCEA